MLLSFFLKSRYMSHFFDYICTTKSCRHNLFNFDLWPHRSFRTKLSKTVQTFSRKGMTLVEVDLKVTFSFISPESKVSTMIHFNLICGHIVAFTRVQDSPNPLSQSSPSKRCEFYRGRPLSLFFDYISA